MESSLAREHLVEDRAEREDVRAGVGGLAADLLGRHVAERAEDDAGLRALGLGREIRSRSGPTLVLVRQLGEAEVEDLDAAVRGDEEILGFQVAVDDALVVRRREAVGDLTASTRRALRGEQLAAGERRAQRLALEQLLDDVRRTVVRPDVVDGGDVRVVERARRPRFLLEAPQPLRVLAKTRPAAP